MKKIRLLTTGQIFEIDIAEELKSGQEMLVEIEGIIEPAIFCSGSCSREAEKKEIRFVKILSDEDLLKKKHSRLKCYSLN